MYKRIALVGASSTGKTTTFELLRNELKNFTFINESTRIVKSSGFKINEEGTDSTQLAISSFHLAALLKKDNLVLDRCYLDLLVYTFNIKGVSEEVKNYVRETWSGIKNQYTHFIYFPIEFSVVEDGVRSVNEEWRVLIDNAFKQAFEEYNIQYLVATGSPKQKVNSIIEYIK